MIWHYRVNIRDKIANYHKNFYGNVFTNYNGIDFHVRNSPFARDKKGGWVDIFTLSWTKCKHNYYNN